MAKQFNAEYISTTVLGTLSGDRKIELGHYKEKDTGKEYGDKIYITGTYTNRSGEQKSFVNATGLTIKDLAELQTIDLSKFDTKGEASFD